MTFQNVQQVRDAIEEAARKAAQEQVLDHVARHVLIGWHTAYIAKAHGGTDEHGETWPPLAESTRRRKEREKKDRRNNQWEKRYGEIMIQLMAGGMSQKDAQVKANSLAWQSMPGHGDTINIETSRLEKSLDPHGGDEQVKEMSGNTLSLGTSVPYARYVNAVRRILPTAEEAQVYVRRAAEALRDEMAKMITR